MLVLIGSEKGGVGKSTLACHAAVRLAMTGKPTCLVDCDPQGTSHRWAQLRGQHRPEAPAVGSEQLHGDIRQGIRALARQYQHLVVDCGGADSRALRSGMLLAHRLIIPTRVARRDLETLSHVAQLVLQAQEARPADRPLITRVVFNMTRALPNFWARIDDARQAVESMELEVCPRPLVERVAYDDSQRQGGTVFDGDSDPKASEEMEAVLRALLRRQGEPTEVHNDEQ